MPTMRPHGPVVRTVRHDPADRPLLVIWEATRACALSCVHCRAEAAPRRHPRELDTDEATELMRQVASFGRPAPIFVITGGDCFEREDLTELVRRGRALGLAVAVSPSGTDKLDRAALVALQDAGVTAMSLSLDGATAAVHDGFRRVPGTFDRTVEAWAVARELGMKVQVNSTMSSRTVHELPDLAALVRAQGAMTWSAFMLVPMGRGVDLGALSAQQAEDVMNYLYDLGPHVPVKTTEGHHFRRVALQRAVLADRGVDHVAALGLGDLYAELTERTAAFGWGDGERTRRPPLNVNAGYGFVFVSHVGTVHPSGFLPVAAGDVREQTLPDIYRSSPLFTGLRDSSRLTGRCGTCEFARVCGGSRSRAYAATGDAFAADPLCAYEPGSFPYPQDVAALLAS
ncbi:MAG: TIGR04053 family radical SAM/SPASM domain-containing protein [Cellulomonas sp.]|nr:TIGR04053 family radical SAM/SPASM domain-containing protein [Cellulomonas sp.]MCR6646643.1 TIGR04053 family radical SAM/SPASM domain-containing protein [Cellulomonas sp.]